MNQAIATYADTPRTVEDRSRIQKACARILEIDAQLERIPRRSIEEEIRTKITYDRLLNERLAAERHLVRLGRPRSFADAAAMAQASFVMGIDEIDGKPDIYGDQTPSVIVSILEWLMENDG